MALSFVTYIGDGVTTDYPIPFPYLEQSHIFLYINGINHTDFSFLTGSTVRLASPVTPGSILTIRRKTPRDVRLVDFSNVSIFDEKYLNLDSEHLFYIMQEITDTSQESLYLDTDNTYQAAGRRIKDIATPVNPSDAVNKAYTDGILSGAQAAADTATMKATEATNATNTTTANVNTAIAKANEANNAASNAIIAQNSAVAAANSAATAAANAANSASSAADSAVTATNKATEVAGSVAAAAAKAQEASDSAFNASLSESNALVHEINATAAEINASASEAKAIKWADEAVDVEVESGKYSARHWAAKAQALSLGANTVVTDVNKTITAQHTFAPATARPPFLLGTNAQGQLVPGLNTDRLQGAVPSTSATNDSIVKRNNAGNVATNELLIMRANNYLRFDQATGILHIDRNGGYGNSDGKVNKAADSDRLAGRIPSTTGGSSQGNTIVQRNQYGNIVTGELLQFVIAGSSGRIFRWGGADNKTLILEGEYGAEDGKIARAADSERLGGVAASGYALASHTQDGSTITGTVPDSAKLGGQPALYYAAGSHSHDLGTLSGIAPDSAKLGGVEASAYLTASQDAHVIPMYPVSNTVNSNYPSGSYPPADGFVSFLKWRSAYATGRSIYWEVYLSGNDNPKCQLYDKTNGLVIAEVVGTGMKTAGPLTINNNADLIIRITSSTTHGQSVTYQYPKLIIV